MNELDWKQPALVGGVIAGLLSAIPGISLVNCCFCAWLLVGGAVAAKMLIDRTPRPVRGGEGAQVGAMAGLIAAGIYLVISIPVILLAIGESFQRGLFEQMAGSINNPEIQEALRKAMEESVNQTSAQRFISSLPFLIISAVLFVGFSTLGGLLGVALFEKRRDQPPPPQYPPSYPPNYPPNYPPQSPPQSGGSGGDRGGWPQG
ncbi:MAG: hypothetical protein ACREAM_05040 [Blastocatellia bacterium]